MKPALPFVVLLSVAVGAQLFTSGPHLVSSAGERVRLKCVNWYGAHQELFVVGGLERTSILNITKQIIAMGANCVRLPFSIDLWKINPVPPSFALGPWINDECQRNATALQIFDCVINILTGHGLMVILNNHNSYAGWIGDGGSLQGLWNLPNYSVHMWLDCLEQMARRYKDNQLVVGMDLRNEIYDMRGVYITWAKSNEITTDWHAASTAADDRLEVANPGMLVIVSGLCFGYDLTDMMERPGPAGALRRRKLVYTTHVYVWDWWWMELPWSHIAAFAAALLLFGASLALLQYRRLKPAPLPPARELACCVLSALGPFAATWCGAYVFWHDGVAALGCSALAKTLRADIAVSGGLALLAVPCTVRLALRAGADARRLWLAAFGALCCLQAAYLLLLALVSQSYAMVEHELGRWGLDGRPVPVWVGEFGSATDDGRPAWRHLVRFLRAHELDFAYWPLNGRKWDQGERRWHDESFGLLAPDYAAWRNPALVAALFD